MTLAQQLISDLRAKDATITASNRKPQWQAPVGIIDADMLKRLKSPNGEIIAKLAQYHFARWTLPSGWRL